MFKLFKIMLIGIPLLIIIGLLVLYFSLNTIIKKGIKTIVPEITQTEVAIEDIDLKLFKGEITIKNLDISNPDKFNEPHIIKSGTVFIKMNIKSIFSDKIIINKIHVKAPELTYEGVPIISDSNIEVLQQNIEKFLPKSEKKDDEEGGKKVIIEEFIVEKGKINVAFNSGIPKIENIKGTLEMPRIELKDIGKESDKSTKDVVIETFNKVLNPVLDIVNASDLYAQGQEALKAAGALLKDVGETAKGIGKDAAGTVKDIGKGAKDTVKGIGDGIKKLNPFKKDKDK